MANQTNPPIDDFVKSLEFIIDNIKSFEDRDAIDHRVEALINQSETVLQQCRLENEIIGVALYNAVATIKTVPKGARIIQLKQALDDAWQEISYFM